MICNNCKTNNLESAVYCRSCGRPLYSCQETTLDKFPEYEFMPSSVVRIQGHHYMWFIIVPLCILLAYCLALTPTCIAWALSDYDNGRGFGPLMS